jgi:hypothetical protein
MQGVLAAKEAARESALSHDIQNGAWREPPADIRRRWPKWALEWGRRLRVGRAGEHPGRGRLGCSLGFDRWSSEMKLEAATFRQLRLLAPVLDDVLNAGEVEHADQAVDLAALATLCSQLFDAYRCLHPDDTEQARIQS